MERILCLCLRSEGRLGSHKRLGPSQTALWEHNPIHPPCPSASSSGTHCSQVLSPHAADITCKAWLGEALHSLTQDRKLPPGGWGGVELPHLSKQTCLTWPASQAGTLGKANMFVRGACCGTNWFHGTSTACPRVGI